MQKPAETITNIIHPKYPKYPAQVIYSYHFHLFSGDTSKKYNVIIDPINPDIVIHSDLNYNENQIDTYTGQLPTNHNQSDKNKKFLYFKIWQTT